MYTYSYHNNYREKIMSRENPTRIRHFIRKGKLKSLGSFCIILLLPHCCRILLLTHYVQQNFDLNSAPFWLKQLSAIQP